MSATRTPGMTLTVGAIEMLRRLAEARDASEALGLDAWEFALSRSDLQDLNLSETVLRLLIANGHVDHSLEQVKPENSHRAFRQISNLALTEQSCFVILPTGIELTKQTSNANLMIPRWDSTKRQLWLGTDLVKWFRVPAKSQTTILAAFEEEAWPYRIDDPLSHEPLADPQSRLHEAVKGLNRNQLVRRLVFHRDGSGEGITWEFWRGQ